MRFARRNLLARLFILVLVATLPSFAVLVSVQQRLHDERLTQAQQNAGQTVSLVDQSLSDVLVGSKAFLSAAAEADAIAAMKPNCGARLDELRTAVPGYTLLAVVGQDGSLLCVSADEPLPGTLAEQAGRWIKRPPGFSVGGYATISVASPPVLTLGLGWPASATRPGGAIVAGLSLDWLKQRLLAPLHRADAGILVADRAGKVLVSLGPLAIHVGEQVPEQVQGMLHQAHSVTLLQQRPEGVLAIGFIPPAEEPNGLLVGSGFNTQDLGMVLDATAKLGYLLLATATLMSLVMAAWGLHHHVRKPAAILLQAAGRWGEGDLGARARMPPNSSGEFDGLARAFNRMAETLQAHRAELQGMNDALEVRVAERTHALLDSNNRLQVEIAERELSEDNLRQAQKLQAVGQLAAGIAHNFNNLLGAMLGSLELLQKRMSDFEQGQTRLLEIAKSAVSRGSWLTAQLLAFSRKQPLLPVPVAMTEAVGAVETLLRSTLGPSIDVVSQVEPDLWSALADPHQLEVAILNLALNARDAMPEGGKLTIVASNTTIPKLLERPDLATGDYVRVAVMDTGSGMPPEVLARAFEPFFTTKDAGQGAGLGLSQVHGMVTQLGGSVTIDSRPGAGTRVSMLLPRSVAGPLEAVVERREPAGPSLRYDQLVLLVDDDDDVREVTAGILEDAGYAVVMAIDGPAALAVMDREGDAVALVVADYVMPGMTGRELWAEIRRRRPTLPFLLATGYADHVALAGDGLSADHIVRKPFRSAELLARIQRVLAQQPSLAA